MKQKEEFFMPMVHEAVDRFLRHLTVDVAKPIFDLLQYRAKYGLTEEELMKRFERVVIEEQIYQYYLSRMRMELEQLYNLTPPYLHRKLRNQIKSLPLILENAIERKSVISLLKASNKFSVEKKYRHDGAFELKPVPRSKAVLDMTLLSTSYFNEYVAILNSMLFYFKDVVSVFEENGKMRKAEQKENLPPISEYLAPPLKPFMINWNKFLDVCYTYSRVNIKHSQRNEPVIECFSKEDGKYQWKRGLPLLGEFITTLEDKNVQILRPGLEKKELAELFLDFFMLKDRFNNPKYLSLKIRPISPPKLFYFSNMKQVCQLT